MDLWIVVGSGDLPCVAQASKPATPGMVICERNLLLAPG
jgi:hypothetical protein